MFGNPAYYVKLGLDYMDLGEYEKAMKAYKKAIRKKPDYAMAYAGLGLAYNYLGREQEAIEAVKHASRLDPIWEGYGGIT
jgi:tetratricopeptide (TPR) repeat protein